MTSIRLFLIRRGGILLVLACLIAVSVQTISAAFIVPLPFPDANAFIPAAVTFRSTGTLANHIYAAAYLYDPAHLGRFIFYPPLFPWLVGSLMPTATPRAAFAVLAAFRILTILALALLIVRAARNLRDADSWILLGTGSVLLIAEAGMRVPTVGRPEALASLFVVGAISTLFLNKEGWRLIALTVASGLIGATHPVGAVISIMLLSGYFTFTHAPRSACARALAVGLGGATISLAIIAVSPNGFVDTILGTATHASVQIQRHAESW
jgi:hypothetical protein